MLKQIFTDLLNVLKEIPGFRYVGEDWGQLNFEQPPVNFPCALVDINNINYASGGMGMQRGEATIDVTVADMRYNGITPDLPQPESEQAFKIFDLINIVNSKLHNSGNLSVRLCRISTRKRERDDAVREFVIVYKFAYTDTVAMPERKSVPAKPDIIIK